MLSLFYLFIFQPILGLRMVTFIRTDSRSHAAAGLQHMIAW